VVRQVTPLAKNACLCRCVTTPRRADARRSCASVASSPVRDFRRAGFGTSPTHGGLTHASAMFGEKRSPDHGRIVAEPCAIFAIAGFGSPTHGGLTPAALVRPHVVRVCPGDDARHFCTRTATTVHRPPSTGHRSLTTDHLFGDCPPATNHWPPATDRLPTSRRPPTIGYRPPSTGHRSLTTDHLFGDCPPATNHWPPATDRLATSYRSPATGHSTCIRWRGGYNILASRTCTSA
jgi:hypothetical protein